MAKLRISLLILFLNLSFSSIYAQVNRYMVFFTDKEGTTYSTLDPSEFLSERAITRRLNQGIDVVEQDLPVNSTYVQGVRETGADVFFQSKWFNGVLVQCDQSLIPAIENLSFVDRVEFVAPQNKLQKSSGGRTKFNLRKKSGKSGEETANQLGMIGIPQLHQDGYNGSGLIVAVFDAGFHGVNTTAPFSHLFEQEKIDLEASHDFVYNTKNVFSYDDHGTEVFSVIAAEIPDVFNAGAPGASFQLYVTEDADDEHRIEEYNWVFAAERADSAGVDIINSSLGYYDFDIVSMNYTKEQMNGQTAVITRGAQYAADRGMVVVTSAGNEGNVASWRIISAPADANDVLAVGSVDAAGTRSNSSSIGPTADGRIKPDVAARGVAVRTIGSDGNLTSSSGTSLSAPLITSLVACVWQRFPELTNLEVMDLIRNSGSQASNPDNLLGYGIPNYVVMSAYKVQREQRDLFVLYPNPVSDSLVISAKNPESASDASLSILNTNGRLLLQQNMRFSSKEKFYQVDVSALPVGLYFLRIESGVKKYVYKIVRE